LATFLKLPEPRYANERKLHLEMGCQFSMTKFHSRDIVMSAEISEQKKRSGRGGPRANSGGPRRGAGRKPFEPLKEQRELVKLLVGSGRPQESICAGIINPETGKPISVETFQKAFAHEIEVGRSEMDALIAKSAASRIKKGSDTMIIWHQKNLWGWRNEPEPKQIDAIEPGAATIRYVIEMTNALPTGSTKENPEGTEPMGVVPPEEGN
jgi:hypothetical protein